jgi:hypothetical protein
MLARPEDELGRVGAPEWGAGDEVVGLSGEITREASEASKAGRAVSSRLVEVVEVWGRQALARRGTGRP